jgi:hypothetical protein
VSPNRRDRDIRKGPPVLLFVLLGGGAILLGMCCLGTGLAVYFLFPGGNVVADGNLPALALGDPDKELIGRWQYDGTFGNHQHAGSSPTLEFNDGGKLKLVTDNPAFRFDNGTWRILDKQGASLTVEVSYQEVHVHPGGKEFSFPAHRDTYHLTLANHNELRRKFDPRANGGLRYKRIGG